MNHSPYDPPVAPVAEPLAIHAPARWKWLFVPLGHSVFLFMIVNVMSSLAMASTEASFMEWLLNGRLAWLLFKEAAFQGAVLLVVTTAIFWALPRIYVLHAAGIGLVSAVTRIAVSHIESYLYGPATTNGQHLTSMVVTYAVVLLVCGTVLRKVLARTN